MNTELKAKKRGFFNMHIDMTEGPLYKNFILYMLPLFISSLIQQTYTAADMMILGQFAGDTAVAAVGATSSLVNLVVQLFMGVAIGYNIVLLRFYGAKDAKQVKSVNSTALIFALSIGVIMMAVGMIFTEPFLRLTNCPEEIIADAALYARIYFLSLPATMVYNHFTSLVKASGDTVSGLMFIITSGITNIGLNLFFVLVVGVPVAGVAIATTVSIYVATVLVFVKCTRIKGFGRLELRGIRFSFSVMGKFVKLGLPSSVSNTLSSLVAIISSSILNSYGPAVIAGNTAALSVNTLLQSVLCAMYSAATSFMTQNIGARKRDNVIKIKRFALTLLTATSTIISVVMFTLHEPLLLLYLPDAPDALSAGTLQLFYLAVTMLTIGPAFMLSAIFSAYGKATFQMIKSLAMIALNVFWLLVIYRAFPSLHTLFLYSPVSQIVSLLISIVFERIYTARYLRGVELTI